MNPGETAHSTPAVPDWKEEYKKLEARAGKEAQPGDTYFMATESADLRELLYALLLAYLHLKRDLTFARAVEYCGTVRLVTHEFFILWDESCGLPSAFTYLVVKTIKEGNGLLAGVRGEDEKENEKLAKYRESCEFRWGLYRKLREEGREAVRQFVAEKAKDVLKGVQP